MLNLFPSKKLTNLVQTIQSGETLALAKQLKKTSPEKLIEQQQDQNINLLCEAIKAQQAKSLELLLQLYSSLEQPIAELLPIKEANSYLQFALQQKNSLPLFSVLLKYSTSENLQPLLTDCFEHCSEQELMLHLSQLINHGAVLTEEIILKVFNSEQRPLIHFFIQQGATMPESTTALTWGKETCAYAQKCIEDKKIREMFL